MGSKKINLNLTYSLGKNKKTGEWEVGEWANQTLWSIDGTNRRLAEYKDFTDWRFFVTSADHESEVELTPGQRVLKAPEEGPEIAVWYYVVCSLKSGDGKFKYLVAV